MKIEQIEEYLDLIDQAATERLYKVFNLINSRVSVYESEISIYNFHQEYLKEITVLEELEILEWDYDDEREENYYEAYASQMDMARISKLFREKNPLINNWLSL